MIVLITRLVTAVNGDDRDDDDDDNDNNDDNYSGSHENVSYCKYSHCNW